MDFFSSLLAVFQRFCWCSLLFVCFSVLLFFIWLWFFFNLIFFLKSGKNSGKGKGRPSGGKEGGAEEEKEVIINQEECVVADPALSKEVGPFPPQQFQVQRNYRSFNNMLTGEEIQTAVCYVAFQKSPVSPILKEL